MTPSQVFDLRQIVQPFKNARRPNKHRLVKKHVFVFFCFFNQHSSHFAQNGRPRHGTFGIFEEALPMEWTPMSVSSVDFEFVFWPPA